ncbi:putative cytochrome P450 49a1 [Crassostrea virginica]
MEKIRHPARQCVQGFVRRFQHTVASPSPGPDTESAQPFEDIPGPSGIYSLPFIGTALHLHPFTSITVQTLHKLLHKFTEEYGTIMKFRAGNNWLVVVSDPKYSEQVLRFPDKYPFRPSIGVLDAYYERKKLSPGLSSLQGEQWAKLRKPAGDQMMRPTSVTSYLPALTPIADEFVAKYENTLRIDDSLKTLVRFTTESIGMLCFNTRLGCLDGTANLDFVEDLGIFFRSIDETGRHVKPYRYFRTPLYNKFERAADNMYRVAREEMQKALDKMAVLEKEGKLEEYLKEPNFLNSLISHPDMTHANAQSLILDLFVGGIDSTSNALTFLWHELALHQDKQERLYQEIRNVIGNGNLDVNSLAKMSYLKACVKESLRKNYPLGVGSVRRLKEDMIIGGYRLQKGQDVLIPLRNMSQDAKYYKNPDKFIPERFLRGDQSVDEETRHTEPFAYVPFGFGPRSCIGQRFAESEMFIITMKLFQAYNVSLAPEVPEKLEYIYRIFACPTTEVNFLLRKRN